jgi:glycosyltransferase involved in cell wall biosynthesis
VALLALPLVPSAICVSLVVPVRDEAGSIEALLASIKRQVRPPEEVVIVDGGSTDGTPDIVRRLTAGDARYRLIEAGPATPGRGRNVGVDAASHPWVAFNDAGIDLDPHWLDRLVRVVAHDPDLDIVYGCVSTARSSWFERCADLAYVSPMVGSPVGPVRPRAVPSSLVRKEAWSRAGGFPDLRAAEDLIFLRRLDALGCRTATAPEARGTWRLQPTARLTFDRFRRYSMHNVLAGQQRYWHHGVARQYLALLGVAAVARAAGRSPAPLLVAAGSLRVGRTLWRRREGRGFAWVLRPDRFATVAAILIVIDAATFAGWADALLVRRGLRSAS